jgi:hypothetical protein
MSIVGVEKKKKHEVAQADSHRVQPQEINMSTMDLMFRDITKVIFTKEINYN